MAVLKMQRITVLRIEKEPKSHPGNGCRPWERWKIDISLPKEEGLMQMDTAGSRFTFLKYAQMADRSLEILEKLLPQKAVFVLSSGWKGSRWWKRKSTNRSYSPGMLCPAR